MTRKLILRKRQVVAQKQNQFCFLNVKRYYFYDFFRNFFEKRNPMGVFFMLFQIEKLHFDKKSV